MIVKDVRVHIQMSKFTIIFAFISIINYDSAKAIVLLQ